VKNTENQQLESEQLKDNFEQIADSLSNIDFTLEEIKDQLRQRSYSHSDNSKELEGIKDALGANGCVGCALWLIFLALCVIAIILGTALSDFRDMREDMRKANVSQIAPEDKKKEGGKELLYEFGDVKDLE
jgi:DNA-binding transcriptional MerR regulator